jgi:hypothetical protein
MGDDAQDYTANGPTDIGFRTGGDGTAIDNGVVVSGKIFGVHGIGLGQPGSSFQTCGVVGESTDGIGVKGQCQNGGNPGVQGTSHSGNGVEGFGGAQGVQGLGPVGVRGEGDVTGVVGDGKRNGIGVSGTSVLSFGVKGESTANDGIIGLSRGDRKSGVFGDHKQTTGAVFGVSGRTLSPDGAGINGFSDRGIGVRGDSVTNDGVVGSSRFRDKSGVFGRHIEPAEAGFGVSGTSDSPQGAGVNGFSVGYGGHFRGARAPLRLQPAGNTGHPTNGNHQVGELFVDANGDLFICKGNGTPGTWFRVRLVPA